MDVSACLRCGSTRVAMPSVGTGLVPGATETQLSECRDCGWRGTPLAFDSPDAQRAYRAERGSVEREPKRPRQLRAMGPVARKRRPLTAWRAAGYFFMGLALAWPLLVAVIGAYALAELPNASAQAYGVVTIRVLFAAFLALIPWRIGRRLAK